MTDDAVDLEAWSCAGEITWIGRRILLLHGGTEAQRAAFIAERLAPFLEAPGRLFAFLRGQNGPILNARERPLDQIGTALDRLVDGTGRIGPFSRTSPDLKLERIARADGAFAKLAALTDFLPDTAVIALAEPDLADLTAPDGALLDFVRRVGASQIDAKVILSLDDAALARLSAGLADILDEGPLGQAYAVRYAIPEREPPQSSRTR